jgi:hypothetical protein
MLDERTRLGVADLQMHPRSLPARAGTDDTAVRQTPHIAALANRCHPDCHAGNRPKVILDTAGGETVACLRLRACGSRLVIDRASMYRAGQAAAWSLNGGAGERPLYRL